MRKRKKGEERRAWSSIELTDPAVGVNLPLLTLFEVLRMVWGFLLPPKDSVAGWLAGRKQIKCGYNAP